MAHIPLLAVTVILYNVLAFVEGGLFLTAVLFDITLGSGGQWIFTVTDLLLTLSLFLLYVEMLRATRIDNASVINHGLSLLVFIFCLMEFVLVKEVVSSAFLLITLMSLLDVIAGFTITLASSRRDINIG